MTLQTERLLLRPWQESDAAELYQLAKDPDVGPRAGWPVHTSVEESSAIIRDILSAPETYAIILKSENAVIGSIGLMPGERCRVCVDPTEQDAELGYWIGKPYWGRGIMPEAVNEILRYAFEERGINRMWCAYFAGNEQSKRVQEKHGFCFQYVREKLQVLSEDDIRDEHVNLLVKEEWLHRA